jgi:hypothetical protein
MVPMTEKRGALLGAIDSLTTEHRIDALPEPGLFRDAVLRIVEIESDSFDPLHGRELSRVFAKGGR